MRQRNTFDHKPGDLHPSVPLQLVHFNKELRRKECQILRKHSLANLMWCVVDAPLRLGLKGSSQALALISFQLPTYVMKVQFQSC